MTNKALTQGLTRRTIIFGLIYLLIHTIALPLLMALHSANFPDLFSEIQYNVFYFSTSFTIILVVYLKYLRVQFDRLLDRPLLILRTLARGFLINLSMNVGLILLLLGAGLDLGESPNNVAIAELASMDLMRIMGLAVMLGPIIEEVLFRGILFGSIIRKNRAMAYIVSIVLFALLHVWQYAIIDHSPYTLLYALYYIPTGYTLAYCYERSGTIWAPILFHIGVNATGMSALGG